MAGKIRIHPSGFGFVEREDREPDVFVPVRGRGSALDGDKVQLELVQGQRGIEGRVVEVLERGRARLTGVVVERNGVRQLVPDDPRIPGPVRLVDGRATGSATGAPTGSGARDQSPGLGSTDARFRGDKTAVVAEITHYPTRIDEPMAARILKILGETGHPTTEISKILATQNIVEEFDPAVLAEAEATPTIVDEAAHHDRVDLRHLPFTTIDPETARDFDDAVALEAVAPAASMASGGRDTASVRWRLWVAVADVSHYVTPGSALDRSAVARGCSVYLPNRAVPMLPEQLSAGICSLNPEVDRCAMVARLELDAQGRTVKSECLTALIRSRARLDYGGVAAALNGDLRGKLAKYEPWLPTLRAMRDLTTIMRERRLREGALDLDLPEAKVLLDEDDEMRVRDVVRSRSDPAIRGAYSLVEEFMLAANVAVARWFSSRELATLWRIHPPPKRERIELLADLARSFALTLDVDACKSPLELSRFLKQLKGHPAEKSLAFLALRALPQATYDVNNVGHFGLAFPDYVHFTSPIRRYPDLITHRLLKHQLWKEGKPSGGAGGWTPPSKEELSEMARASSALERRAMEAERESVNMYRAILLQDRIGDEFPGTVTGVTPFGLFVEVVQPSFDGLVRLETLKDDRYEVDERALTLTGRHTGQRYSLGDDVAVKILDVSVARRQIELTVVSHTSTAPAVPAGERPTRERRGGSKEGGSKEGAARSRKAGGARRRR